MREAAQVVSYEVPLGMCAVVPVLLAGARVKAATDIGTRPTFADLGQTLAANFGVGPLAHGTSFLEELGVVKHNGHYTLPRAAEGAAAHVLITLAQSQIPDRRRPLRATRARTRCCPALKA